MNLFIGGNFINSFGNKVDVMQLIRHITENEDTIQSEALAVIEAEHGDELEDLINADDKYATVWEDVLYVDGATLLLILSDLFDGDYDDVAGRIATAIDNLTGPTLNLSSNGFEVIEEPKEEQQELDLPKATGFTKPGSSALPAAAVFDDTPAWYPEMAKDSQAPREEPLAAETPATDPNGGKLPVLRFAGNNIDVRQDVDGGILFGIKSLYFAGYGVDFDIAYIATLIARRRFDLEDLEAEVLVGDTDIFASVNVLAVLHRDLTHAIEWVPIVLTIASTYEDCLSTENAVWGTVQLDLFGNLQ